MPVKLTTLQFRELDLFPSKALAVVFLLGHFLAIVGLWIAGIFWYAQVALTLLLFSVGYYNLYRYILLRHKKSVIKLALRGERWLCTLYSGETKEAHLCEAMVWLQYCVLKFNQDNHHFFVYLTAQSARPEALRLLRIYLRLGQHSA